MGIFANFLKRVLHPGEIEIEGIFWPNGTSAIATTEGRGWSVTRSGAGTFAITLDQAYAHKVGQSLGLQLAAAADYNLAFGDYDEANGTIDIYALQAGVLTDIAADANASIGFTLTMCDTKDI